MIKMPTWWNTRALPSAEWMAENAFLPPGLHRLLTAFGLTSGLWIGREFTDFIVARRSSDGSEIPREQVPQIFRPLHGVMKYNQYSDRPEDRWRNVADGFLPVMFGILGAYLGSKQFFHGKPPELLFKDAKPFHPFSARFKNMKDEALSLSDAVGKMSFHESNVTRKGGAFGYLVSGTAGTHLLGSLLPLGAGNIAIPFQIGAGRKINVFKTGIKEVDHWIVKFNKFMGNRSAGSRYLPAAMNDMVKWAEGNMSLGKSTEEWAHNEELLKRAKDMLQIFKDLPVSEQESVAQEIFKTLKQVEQTAKDGKWAEMGQEEFTKLLHAELSKHFKEFGHEKIIIAGLKDPNSWKKLAVVDNGPFSEIARVFGSAKQEQQILKTLAKRLEPELEARYGQKVNINTEVKAHPLYVAGGGAALAGITIGSLALGGTHHRKERQQAFESDPHKQDSRHAQADRQYTEKKEQPKNLMQWVNGTPLDVSQWFSRILIQPPSMHRFMNAMFLSGALFGGVKFANILTGRNLLKIKSLNNAESIIKRDDVWGIFKPFHGVLEYTPGSSEVRDRWRGALHMIIPVGIGAVGTVTGSHYYFRDRIDKIKSSKSEFLEDYADKAVLQQSKFFAAATGITSIFNTGSGIHLLPFFNYSANMQNRFVMAAGYQVALPGVGKWWSGNEGLYPWGIKRTLNFTVNYAAYNPDEFPEQLPSLVHSVLAKLYPKVPSNQLAVKEREFVENIYKLRDPYLVNGHIPEDARPELHKLMKSHLMGAGFEKSLMAVGLDPRDADIANNGVSGHLANVGGQGLNVRHLKKEYVERFSERVKRQKEHPEIKENNSIDGPLSERSFSERIKSTDHSIPVSL